MSLDCNQNDFWGDVGAGIVDNKDEVRPSVAAEIITGVRAKDSLTPPPAALPSAESTNAQSAQVIPITQPYKPDPEKPPLGTRPAVGVARKPTITSSKPPRPTVPLYMVANDQLPISEATPVHGVCPEHLRASVPPEDIVTHVNKSIPPRALASALRAPTRHMQPADIRPVVTDAHPSDRPTTKDATETTTLEQLAEMVVIDEASREAFRARLTSTDHHPTILPPAPIDLEADIAEIRAAIHATKGAVLSPLRHPEQELQSVVIDHSLPVMDSCQTLQSVIVDENLVEHPQERFITDPEEKVSWWKALGKKVKETANNITARIRSTLAGIFNFRLETRHEVMAVLTAAAMGAVAAIQTTPTSQGHQHPSVSVAPIAVQHTPPAPILEHNVSVSMVNNNHTEHAPVPIHSSTITVGKNSPHITFVQALTEFLTNNDTRAQMGNYQHRTGDAFRVLSSMRRDPALAQVAHALRNFTHSGDQFHFAVMSDGTIQLEDWNGRHSASSKLSRPITFALPDHQ